LPLAIADWQAQVRLPAGFLLCKISRKLNIGTGENPRLRRPAYRRQGLASIPSLTYNKKQKQPVHKLVAFVSVGTGRIELPIRTPEAPLD